MKLLKIIPMLALLMSWQGLSASSISEDDSQDQKNQTDAQGKKQGHWVYYGKDKPQASGYAATDLVEEGPYKDNRKHGMWKFYYPANKIKSEIEYKYNRPNGKYTKYHTNGKPSEEGTWKGNKYTGDYKKMNEQGVVVQEKTFNTAGKTTGKVIYRYDNGKTEFEFTTNNGVEVGKATRYYPNGDVKEELDYSEGKVTNRVEKKMVNPAVDPGGKTSTKTAPTGDASKVNPANKVAKLHKVYTKVYNDNKDLEMDGYFENGKLWNGKLYRYDKNGLLFKIEIYKNGKYFGDGVLEF